jgi:hypothetical protein
MNYDDFGTLRIRASSASGAIPIMGAVVRITGGDEEDRMVAKSLITDNDGVTAPVRLPTPNRSYSLDPNGADTPYALYDVVVTADGYYTKRIAGVAIFSGIDAILPVNMIPTSDMRGMNYPEGNLNTVIDEHDLEE